MCMELISFTCTGYGVVATKHIQANEYVVYFSGEHLNCLPTEDIDDKNVFEIASDTTTW